MPQDTFFHRDWKFPAGTGIIKYHPEERAIIMKKTISARLLTCLCAIGGGAAGLLRLWLLQSGVDSRGLLITTHPGNVLSFLLTAVVALPCVFLSLKETAYPLCSSPLSRVGAVIGGIGCAVAGISLLGDGFLPTLTGILGIGSALILVFTKPNALLRCVSVAFLLLLPLQLYRQWSSEPQLLLYFFCLLGSLCLLLWAYHRTALTAGTGNAKTCLLMGRLGIFFCTAAVPGSSQSIFFVCAAVWMLLDGIVKDDVHEAA